MGDGAALVRARPLAVALAVLAAAGTLVAVGRAGEQSSVLPTLYVTYSNTNCTFTINTDSGAVATTIPPGMYQIVISEDDFVGCTQLPNFELTGPGVSIQTPVDSGDGDSAEFDATFQPAATYVALDSNQPAASTVTFNTQASGTAAPQTLTTAAPPAPSTASGGGSSPVGTGVASPAKSVVLRGTLEASVSSAGKPTLSFHGKLVATLLAGKYTVKVADHSKRAGLVIQGVNQAALTVAGTSFVGTRTTTVTLAAGQWFYYPTFVGHKTYFIVVS